MISWIKAKSDVIALGFFVGIISGLMIVCSVLILTKLGILEKDYTRTEVLLICAREGIAEKACKI